VDDIADLAGFFHCAALATCQVLGFKVQTRDETNATQQKSKSEKIPIPTWKKRIQQRSTKPDEISPILPFPKEKSNKKVSVDVRIILKRMSV
jgi:hypothetical protein